MADTDTPTMDTSPQWQPPPVTDDVLMAAMQRNQQQPNELDRLPPPPQQPPQPQQNELDALQNRPSPAAPAQQPMPSSAPIPTTPTSPDTWSHMEGLHRVLNKVADILGPAEIAHVHQDPKTGDFTVTKDPATTSEKWHRIAAAALGGAASGLANSQGPGGLARATAAGIQTGMQMPQQQLQATQEEADFNQKQLLARANRIYLAQQTGKLAADAREQDLKLGTEEEAILNRQADMLTKGNNSRDVGIYDPSDPNAAMKLAQKDPEVQDAFLGKGNQRLRYVLEGDHQIHLVLTDKTEEEQRITQPVEILSRGRGPDDKPIIKSTMGGVGKTLGEVRDSNAAVQTQVLKDRESWAKSVKNAREPAEKDKNPTLATFADTAEDPNATPAERAAAKRKIALMKEKSGTGTSDGEGFGAGTLSGGTPAATAAVAPEDQGFVSQLTQPVSPQGQAILDKLPIGQRNLVQRFGNYLADESKELPRGKERGPFLEMVSSVYPNFDSARYEARRDIVKQSLGNGAIAQSRNALNLAVQHMGEMYDNMNTINPTEYPAINKANQLTHMSAGFGDEKVKDAYGGYEDANEGVATELARVFKGGQPAQTEINQYRSHAGITQPRSAQEGSFKTRSHMLASRLGIINRQLQETLGAPGKNYQLLTPESLHTLARLPGGQEVIREAGYTGVFDAGAWQKANPNGDVNAAIKKAQSQRMAVVQ